MAIFKLGRELSELDRSPDFQGTNLNKYSEKKMESKVNKDRATLNHNYGKIAETQ